MPTIEQIAALCETFGWVSMGKQKNPYMISFRHEETNRRINIYFTRMTVTIEDSNGFQRHHKEVSLIKLEELLS